MGIQNSKSTLNFLDTIGSNDRGDVALNQTAKKLIEFTESLIQDAQNNLNKGGNVATGQLSDIRATDIDADGYRLSISIMLKDYWKYVDMGVQGTQSGKGRFKFKNDKPSRKMVNAIQEWLKIRGGRIKNIKKTYKKLERKDSNIPAKVSAYVIARAIKQKGIKPTSFFTKAVDKNEKKFKKYFGEGIKLDIIESLQSI